MKVNFFNIIFRAVSKNTIIFLHNAVIIIGIYLYFGINPGSSVFLAVPGIVIGNSELMVHDCFNWLIRY